MEQLQGLTLDLESEVTDYSNEHARAKLQWIVDENSHYVVALIRYPT